MNDYLFSNDLFKRVYDQQVILEHLFIRNLIVYGTIRVTNRGFDKQVFLHYTYDQWKTILNLSAYYIRHDSENNTDIFHFKLILLKENISLINSISFAICYRVNNEEFWDNNYSQNYTIHINNTYEFNNDELTRDYQTRNHQNTQIGNFCGLTNLNGTCYINSILQSLYLTFPLTDYIISNVTFKNGLVLNEYRNILLLLHSRKYAVIIPRPFHRMIGERKRMYLNGEQQDAHEFFLCLLEIFHEDFIKKNSSIINHLFSGIYQSTTICLKCHQKSENFEPFISLTVPIPSTTEQCTLDDCLACLYRDELLTGDSQLFCSSCQSYRDATKCLTISKYPNILVIQLKRFQLNFDYKTIKNQTLVLYPEDNLQCYLSSSSLPLIYTLYSVINHNGSLDDGHYTTYSRDLSRNSSFWFRFDDEIIDYIPHEQLNPNSNAYLLFYILKT